VTEVGPHPRSVGKPPRLVARLVSNSGKGGGGAPASMDEESPILEVRQSAWQVSSIRDQRLRIFGDRVELVRPKVTSEARTTVIPLADIDYISVKRFLMAWFDLVIVPKSGAAIRLRPLARSDAEHAEDLIRRQLEKLQS
jgi:hypothetical protein